MKFKRLLLLLTASLCFSWLAAQNECGLITIALEQYRSAGAGTNFGIIKVTVTDSQPDAGVITFKWTGTAGGSSSANEVVIPSNETDGSGNKIYYISSLPAGNYSVTANKYCILEWGGQPVSSTDTRSVQVDAAGTNPSIPEPTVKVIMYRGALSNCIDAGIASFTVTNGTAPYTVTITGGPQNNELIGKTYTFNTASFSIGSLQGGDYTFSVSDKFHAGFKTDLSLSITTYSAAYSYLRLNGGVKPYIDHAEGPYNVFYIEPTNASYISYYTIIRDTIAKYFKLEWHFADAAGTTYPVEYKKLKESDSRKGFYLTLPNGMNFKDVTDGSKQIVVRQSYQPDVLAQGRAGCTSVNREAGRGGKYQPIPVAKSNALKFETYFDFELCRNALRFPALPPSDTELIILPVNYSIYEVINGTASSTPAAAGTYVHEQPERYNKHFLDPSVYLIRYTDKLGNQWEEEIELIYSEPPVMTNIISREPKLVVRMRGRPEDYKTLNDIGTLVNKVYVFSDDGAAADLILKYEEVPASFHFQQGTEIAVPAQTDSITINYDANDGRYYQLTPGRYKISLTPACGVPYTDEFVVDAAGLEDLEYKIVSNCEGVRVDILNARIRLPVPNADGTPRYMENPKFRFMRKKGYRNGNSMGSTETGFPSSYKELAAEGGSSTIIPYSDFSTPATVISYVLTAQFVTNDEHRFTSAEDKYHFIRPIDIDFQNMDVERYYPMAFDYSKSSGYMCGSDAKITSMVTGGLAPYTYSLYETSSDTELPADGAAPLAVVAANENEPAVFTISHADAESRFYWVKVEDSNNDPTCDGGARYQSVKVYNLAGNLAIRKTEELCDGDELVLTAAYVPEALYTWYQGGTISGGTVAGGQELTQYSGAGKNTLTITNAAGENTGTYHVHIVENPGGCGINTIHTADVVFMPQLMVWDPQNNSPAWNDENNWYPKNQGIPKPCTDVYIPGNAAVFPDLAENEINVCRDIYFMPGAQIGQPQLLEYRHAHVQFDFGSGTLGSTQDKTAVKEELVLAGRDGVDAALRVRFGAAASGAALNRDRWNMFSPALGEITTGDFAFGGFPFSYIKKFDPENGSEGFILGKWADYNNELTNKFAPGQGFGHFYYDYASAPYYSMDDNSQWEAVKTASGLNAPQPESIFGGNAAFGLAQSNSILHLPYFADDMLSSTHRGHEYNGIETAGTSTYHFYYQSPRKSVDFLQWTGKTADTYRTAAAYRFIPEQATFIENNLDFTYQAGSFAAGDVILVGNPYMSAFDFDAFATANAGKIKSGYQIFNGTDGYIGSFESAGNPKIAPMQSFLVEAAADGVLSLVFNAKEMAKTDRSVRLKTNRPAAKANQLTVTLKNPAGEVHTYIRQSADAADDFCPMDFSKIISYPAAGPRPEIYSLAYDADSRKRALALNTVGSNNMTIPLGIVTTYSGKMKAVLSGMDLYDAGIVFIDTEAEHPETDVTGMAVFEYDFEYTAELNEDGSAKPAENRFMLRITPKNMTGHDELHSGLSGAHFKNNDLIVYSSSAIHKVELYDLQGRMLYACGGISSSIFKAGSIAASAGVYIVKIYTGEQVQEIKLVKPQ